MIRTPCFYSGGTSSIPGPGTKFPQIFQVRAGKVAGEQRPGARHTYLVHTHTVQSRHSHRGQLVAVVSQAELTVAVVAPTIHLRERGRREF